MKWGPLVAVTIASYTLWDARAVTTPDLDPVLYYAGTGTSMALLVPLAFILVLVAMTMAPGLCRRAARVS